MTSKRPKKYCSVLGCLNNNSSNPDLSFFQIPTEQEVRKTWLQLISREDLADKEPHNYTVCEAHFERHYVIVGNHRRRLKKQAVPRLYLPSGNENIFKEIKITVNSFTQTDFKNVTTTCAQTECSHTLLPLSRRRAGAGADPLGAATQADDHKYDIEDLHTFHSLCDKFLTKELADIVKLQAVLKLQNKI